MRQEIKITFVLEVNKSFFRLILIVGKKRNDRQVQVAVTVKIAGHGFITPVNGEKVLLFEIPMSVV